MSNDSQGVTWPFQAMTFKTAKREVLDDYEADDRFAFEQKMDGVRCMILVTEDGARQVVQRHGEPLKHAASLIHVPDIFKAIGRPQKGWRFVLDGELMFDTGRYICFDMPSLTAPLMPAITPNSPFAHRHRALVSLWGYVFEDQERIGLVRHAQGAESKHLLVQTIKEINGEGVLIKDLGASYGMGARVGHSMKVKFTKTVDVIVLAVDQGRNEAGNLSGSIRLCLLPDGATEFTDETTPVWYGSCSAIGRGDVQPGDVIEVEYLAYMAGGGIREPRMTRKRDDKNPGECTVAQFVEHSKMIL